MTPPPLSTRLLTDRLVIRPPRTVELGELRRVMRRNEAHLKPWNPAPRAGEDPTSITELSSAVLRDRRDWKSGRCFTFMMTLREEPNTFIGRATLHGVVRGALLGAHLGYWIDVDHQGRGLCTEGLRAIMDFAFGPLELHRVQAAIMPSNTRSLRVVERLGFRREGYGVRYLRVGRTWEDHVLFARTSEEHLGTLAPNERSADEPAA